MENRRIYQLSGNQTPVPVSDDVDGLAVAIAIVAFMAYMLFRPYKEATRRGVSKQEAVA